MQGAYSRAKAHKLWYEMSGNAHKAAAHYKRAVYYARFGGDSDEPKPQCTICLDSEPPPIQSGCACRGDAGLAHVACLIKGAVKQQAQRGNKLWWECQTCKQAFTGPMRTRLAEAWGGRVCAMRRRRAASGVITDNPALTEKYVPSPYAVRAAGSNTVLAFGVYSPASTSQRPGVRHRDRCERAHLVFCLYGGRGCGLRVRGFEIFETR